MDPVCTSLLYNPVLCVDLVEELYAYIGRGGERGGEREERGVSKLVK